MGSYLPILIVVSFPLLYISGNQGSGAGAIFGILLLILGMSGSFLKRFQKK